MTEPSNHPPPGPMAWGVALAERFGFGVLLLALFVYWGTAAGSFLAPLAVRLVEATEAAATHSAENATRLTVLTQTVITARDERSKQIQELTVVVKDARDEAHAARLGVDRLITWRTARQQAGRRP